MSDDGIGSNMQTFENKRRKLFDCLDQAEKNLKGTNLEQQSKIQKHESEEQISEVNRSMIKFRGKESIFKKPELPLIKCLKPRISPDYQVNPHKWKKYSLSEVDISDRTNSDAAYAFLREIRNKRHIENENLLEEEQDDSSSKLIFNKSVSSKQQIEDEYKDDKEKPILRGAKMIMPEYVVGQKSKKKSKKQREEKSLDLSKHLTLSHLFDEEDD